MIFTYHKVRGKIYQEPNPCKPTIHVCEWEGSYAYFSLVGGLLCLLLNRGRVLTPISRHNFPPILRGVGIISVPISIGVKLMDIGCPPHTLQIFSHDHTNSKQWFVVRGDILRRGDPLKKKEKKKKKSPWDKYKDFYFTVATLWGKKKTWSHHNLTIISWQHVAKI
jgi:hypothetical protein